MGCELEIVATENSVVVGDDVSLNFSLSGFNYYDHDPVESLIVDLFEDPLCNLSISVTPEPANSIPASRACVTSRFKLPSEEEIALVNARGRNLTYKVSPDKRVSIRLDDEYTYSLQAKTLEQEDGSIKVMFADDVYFSFCGKAYVTFFGRPSYNTFMSSQEGGFMDILIFEQVSPTSDTSPGIRISSPGEDSQEDYLALFNTEPQC